MDWGRGIFYLVTPILSVDCSCNARDLAKIQTETVDTLTKVKGLIDSSAVTHCRSSRGELNDNVQTFFTKYPASSAMGPAPPSAPMTGSTPMKQMNLWGNYNKTNYIHCNRILSFSFEWNSLSWRFFGRLKPMWLSCRFWPNHMLISWPQYFVIIFAIDGNRTKYEPEVALVWTNRISRERKCKQTLNSNR